MVSYSERNFVHRSLIFYQISFFLSKLLFSKVLNGWKCDDTVAYSLKNLFKVRMLVVDASFIANLDRKDT